MPRLAPDDPATLRIDSVMAEWRQGDVALDAEVFVHLADATCALTDEAAAGEDGLQVIVGTTEGVVVLSQTCDIVRSCIDKPFVEVAPLVEVDERTAHEIERGRRPNYSIVPALRKRRMVADLDRVMTVEKSVAAAWSRTSGCTTDAEVRGLAMALARKRARFAFPDDFTKLMKKLQARLIEKHDRESDEGRALRALSEIRVTGTPSWDNPSEVGIFIWFVRNKEDPTFEGSSWDRFLETWLRLVPSQGRFSRIEGVVTTLADMTAQEYVESDPLDLDHLSLREDA